ncbi:MAG: transcriptional regulator [Microcoleus sp. PH2017_01_SCD_O_A]|jgi:DNA-binding phage protein|uniref:helix-turn-helix domain-containing transcriptional regulator n=1 Tax=unclassified Microcoleus TaxID=2642155 RepID=UPI001DE5F9DD|nr:MULTISPECIES: transcriptional regulator [unclassified Microcoleus]MCC3418794.1 transcriptional regulator [Microcoleus sp. PH2017_07_MST_O_A]MCC3429744.1 transcriptional regulator [Microcoleus sp. PH2017_04_SCI_O_A]MCC3502284.1 transcriptional regulator [Microcoleus sp. PH2017_19_SFW_U_A]MCC3512480.1 transcriptional regulator [Microcoleus sp. PH2017_17_BER_D_A]TAE16585.1 MAG: transcriptional regulator [Oscillatoriales cyanobacterium]
MPTSDSYQDYLIEALKDKIHAAAYLTAHLEDEEPEAGLLELALSNVFESLGKPNMSADDAKLHLEKLDTLLSGDGIATIYGLASWLKALGLKLTVAVDAGDEEIPANVAELAEVGNV